MDKKREVYIYMTEYSQPKNNEPCHLQQLGWI